MEGWLDKKKQSRMEDVKEEKFKLLKQENGKIHRRRGKLSTLNFKIRMKMEFKEICTEII